ncbi:efflux RND transporter periplasmic adaptor subunit [Shewanella marina]|uniref:efflux RND transporter periplasmic adaptor subunit n=1 Tax=Shewanella marina TaxID=487319 RepID=UPI00046ED79A|nr:efflux RND transporter periplasmic adaptor subunit [Shewanella marina]
MPILLRRILIPLIIIAVSVGLAMLLVSSKKEPEKKPEPDTRPIVDIISANPSNLSVQLASYGVVSPKYKTQLVTEVQGRLLELADVFVAGGMVKKGQVLARIEPADYQADLSQAQASLAQAQANLDEEIALGEVAKKEWQDFQSGPAPELGLRVPQLKKEQANVKYAQATLARAQRNLDRTVIRAPIDGIIKSRMVDLGQYITMGTTLGELYGTSIAEVRLPLNNNELAYLESIENPNTEVELTAQLAGKDMTWQANIVRSEGIIDDTNRMVYLVAEINDPYQLVTKKSVLPLKYGTFVNASIHGREFENIVKLPRHLVKNNQVAIVKNNVIEMRTVNVVRSDQKHAYIQQSIQPNEQISITLLNNMSTGQEVIVAGEQTKPKTAIANAGAQ